MPPKPVIIAQEVEAALEEGFTRASDLARRFHVSERTIHRRVAELKAAGVRVRSQAGVGYLLRKVPRKEGEDANV